MLLTKWLLITVVAMVAVMVVAAQLGLFKGHKPDDLGVRDGRLKLPALTPNSVSSQALLYQEHPQKNYAAIAPIGIDGNGEAALARIRKIVEAMPGTQIIESVPSYLYAQFTTPILKFVDDVEFWFDSDMNVIHVRSASRLGKSDLGVNRKRIEAIRSALKSTIENGSD
ncbi:MAG: DUF1499 domain-containing protein [Nitrosomonas sp.]|nr:DUF1499 domain-containing protein [Nitrosomonas sp.]